MSNYTRRVVRGTGFVFVMGLFAALFGYFLRLLLARNLSLEGFGFFYALVAFFGLLSIFQGLGLGNSVPKYISEFKVKNRLDEIKGVIIIAFLIQFSVGIILGVAIIILSDFIALRFFNDISTSLAIKVYALTIILGPLHMLSQECFQGFQRIKYYSMIDFLKMSFILAITFILLNAGMGVFAPIIAYVMVYLLPLTIYFPLFFRKVFPSFFKIKATITKGLVSKLVKFGMFVILTGLAGMVFSYTDTILLTLFRSLEEVALYNVALPTARVLWKLSATLVIVLLPLSSELWEKKEIEKLRNGLIIMYKYSMIAVLPVSLLMLLFPKIILRVLFGPEYVGAAVVLQIFSIGAMMFALALINNSIISGIGRPATVSKIMFGAAAFNVAGNLILIPTYGIDGAGIATVISFGIVLFFTTASLRKLIKMVIPWVTFIKILLVGIIFAAIIALIKGAISMNVWAELFISVMPASIIYVLALFLFRVVEIKEIESIVKRVL